MAGVAGKSVDFAFDKGTLDAMIHGSPWNPPETVKENSSGYTNERCAASSNGGAKRRVSGVVVSAGGVSIASTQEEPEEVCRLGLAPGAPVFEGYW
ncbi:hypothetical protein MHUMG1_01081 [Metarhizium humberi]|uniref:Uncharacterized protein n=1 Tax=Metarhizium humberi TaxID=2596975 RepID=A0A9P8MKE2_9HYPO|nr:hypothetical protein MHUMG1_01081 [Metarhizium humberi]